MPHQPEGNKLKKSGRPQKKKSNAVRSTKSAAAASKVITFYRANERPYGVFSNLYRAAIEFEGKCYPTAEHAYQAGKAAKPEVRDWILSAPTPSLAAMAAHGLYTWDIVPNWAQIKFDRMSRVLRAKFTQHPELAEVLLSTGAARLVEAGTVNNSVNRLWGEVNGVGQNMLGVMLMELRRELAKARPRISSKGRSKRASAKPRALDYSSQLSQTAVAAAK
jgi:ribA/ribD-fused uncharacterized protein